MGGKADPKLGGCTQQEDNFARYYVLYGKASVAYRKAYDLGKDTDPKSLWSMASRTLHLRHVEARIDHYRKIAAKKWEVSVERIVQQASMMAFVDKRDIYDEDDNLLPPSEWPEHIARCVAGIEVFEEYDGRGKDRVLIGHTKKVHFESRATVLAMLAKHKGMLIERVETGLPGEFDHLTDEDLARQVEEERASLRAIERGTQARPPAVAKPKAKAPAKKKT